MRPDEQRVCGDRFNAFAIKGVGARRKIGILHDMNDIGYQMCSKSYSRTCAHVMVPYILTLCVKGEAPITT